MIDRYKLIVAANRDEFLDREAEPLHFWNDTDSDIVAGTDTIRGGTWLGSFYYSMQSIQYHFKKNTYKLQAQESNIT